MTMDLEASDSSARARAILTWAEAAATDDPGVLSHPPEQPTPAEYRALETAVVRKHLDAIMLGRHTETGLDALQQSRFLDVWLPEVAAMVGFGDGEWRHKDVWKHTKQVVYQSVPRLEVRWGALLHDIGKPKTRKIEPTGEVHFHGHAELGASMFRKRIADRLGFEGPLRERVHFLILYHLRASHYEDTWTDAAVRRFARDMGEGLIDLLDLSRADITTKRPQRKKRGLVQISELSTRIRELVAADAYIPPLPKGIGNAMMEAFGIPPSKRLGEIKRELERRCTEGELEPNLDTADYIAYLEAHRDDFDL